MLDYTTNLVENNGAFIETDATITIDGHSFSSGGAFLAKRTDTEKYGGTLYAYNRHTEMGTSVTNNWGEIGSWDGTIKIPAFYGGKWKSGFGDIRQNVWFKHQIEGETHYFYGVYMCSGSDLVHCREVENWEK